MIYRSEQIRSVEADEGIVVMVLHEPVQGENGYLTRVEFTTKAATRLYELLDGALNFEIREGTT